MTVNSQDHKKRQLPFLLGSLVVLIAIGLRVHHLANESLFMDELHQVSYYQFSPTDIVDLAAGQQQPPLDYWIGHYISKLSSSDFFVRLPSMLFGVGSVLMIMIIIAKKTNLPIALGTGLLLALSPYHIYFSQDARPYSIAIFFFLTTLWTLEALLTDLKRTIPNLVGFGLSIACLLLSRTLAPLVICMCLISILAAIAIMSRFKPDWVKEITGKRAFLAIIAIMVTLSVYSPLLMNILEKGARYVSNPTGLDVAAIKQGLVNFTLVPLWRAYIAQLEPLGYLLLPLLIVGPVLALGQERRLVVLVPLALLPLAALLNLLVFQIKTSMPFRPPYAIYLLPLCLIVGAQSIYWLTVSLSSRRRKTATILTSAFALMLLVFSILSMVDFKSNSIKSDWKGVAEYLAENLDQRHLLVFDGVHPLDGWEPTFYGFPRYYRGSSARISVGSIPSDVELLATTSLEPVLVLFLYTDYFLTENSSYPIVPAPHQPITLASLLSDSLLETKTFTGFIIVRLKDYTGRVLSDTLQLTERLISAVPENDIAIDLHLAASALARKEGAASWQQHLLRAKQLSDSKDMRKIKPIIRLIEQLE